MPLGLLLILYLLVLYFVVMLVLCHYLRPKKTEAPLDTKVRFALKEGQTIVGIGDTKQGIDFYIGDYVGDEKYYDL